MIVLIITIIMALIAVVVFSALGFYVDIRKEPAAVDAPPAAQPAAEPAAKPRLPDIAVLEEIEKQLPVKPVVPEVSEYDKLCNLKIGRSFYSFIKNLLTQAMQERQTIVAVRFDIDRFRYINSLKGAAVGDYVLSRLAGEAGLLLPPGTQLTRISADHFLAFFALPNATLEETLEPLLRLGDTIRSDIGMKGSIRISAGVATTTVSDPASFNFNILDTKADLARHSVKIARDSVFAVYDSEITSSYLFGESALGDYNDHKYADDIALIFVPRLNLGHGKISSARVTAVWAGENGVDSKRLAGPGGVLPSNHAKVIYQACLLQNRWKKSERHPVPLSVPLPAMLLYKKNIEAFLEKCLSDFSVEPDMLCLVVDAPAIHINYPVAQSQLLRLRQLGISVALRGISTAEELASLEGLALTHVLLPEALSQEIETDQLALQRLGQLASQISARELTPVFLGIQNIEQMRRVQSIGGIYVEGHYAGKPATSDEFALLLHANIGRTPAPGGSATVILDEVSMRKGNYKI